MSDQQKKEPKEPLKIDLPFEETLAAMLQVPPEEKPPPKKPATAKKKPKKAKK